MADSLAPLLARTKREAHKLIAEPREWFFLVGDRLVLAGLLTLAFSIPVFSLEYVNAVGVRSATPMLYLFGTLAGGNLTLITIVVSINQLIISRELKTPGDLQTQIQNVITYRRDVEEMTNRNTVPVTPFEFLRVLLDQIGRQARSLRTETNRLENQRLAEEVDDLATQLAGQTDDIQGVLDSSREGVFSVLAVILEVNYSQQLAEVHRLRTAYEDDLSGPAEDAFEDLAESLRYIDIARQYFKAIYFQDELSQLSRFLLYVGTPTVSSSILILLVYSGSVTTGVLATLLSAFVPVTVVLGFVPLAVLISFVLRISVVAQRTLAITPFATQDSDL